MSKYQRPRLLNHMRIRPVGVDSIGEALNLYGGITDPYFEAHIMDWVKQYGYWQDKKPTLVLQIVFED